MAKIFFFIIGTICFAAGAVGLLLPVIPQIPFLMAGTICFMLGSEKFSNWVKDRDIYKNHVRPWVKKIGFLSKLLGEEAGEQPARQEAGEEPARQEPDSTAHRNKEE